MPEIRPIKRTSRGTFARGTAGGPGRPPRPVEKDYLRALSDACPPDRWRQIVEKAVQLAEQGDGQARSWLAKYLLGEQTLWGSLTLAEEQEHMMNDLLGAE
jgi:hypothetical protein